MRSELETGIFKNLSNNGRDSSRTNSKDGWHTTFSVCTSAETTTDSNSHQAEPVSYKTERAEVNSNTEAACKHKQKRKKY